MSLSCTNTGKSNITEKVSDSLYMDTNGEELSINDSIQHGTSSDTVSNAVQPEYQQERYFTVVYRQLINGYRVKAKVEFENDFFEILSADLFFTKKGKTFTLHSDCFGDTVYCKGRLDYNNENHAIFRKYQGKTIYADYNSRKKEGSTMLHNTPFFFKDLDFDGIRELVIVHYSCAGRYGNGYSVYRIVEGNPIFLDYPPFNKICDYNGDGMTDVPIFDYRKKTVTCPYPEGEFKRIGQKVYAVSRKKKDIIKINGRNHYFNHLVLVRDEKY